MPPSEMVSFRLGSEVRARVDVDRGVTRSNPRGEVRESDWMREAVFEKLARASSPIDDTPTVIPSTSTNLAGRTEQFRRAAEVAASRRKSA